MNCKSFSNHLVTLSVLACLLCPAVANAQNLLIQAAEKASKGEFVIERGLHEFQRYSSQHWVGFQRSLNDYLRNPLDKKVVQQLKHDKRAHIKFHTKYTNLRKQFDTKYALETADVATPSAKRPYHRPEWMNNLTMQQTVLNALPYPERVHELFNVPNQTFYLDMLKNAPAYMEQAIEKGYTDSFFAFCEHLNLQEIEVDYFFQTALRCQRFGFAEQLASLYSLPLTEGMWINAAIEHNAPAVEFLEKHGVVPSQNAKEVVEKAYQREADLAEQTKFYTAIANAYTPTQAANEIFWKNVIGEKPPYKKLSNIVGDIRKQQHWTQSVVEMENVIFYPLPVAVEYEVNGVVYTLNPQESLILNYFDEHKFVLLVLENNRWIPFQESSKILKK
ncbi:MAG: hypothetical protein IKO35_04455 [Elusimicrobiaceae bacterium]|nr:hypothetical protein [Elusimicrobiaceae bacterium]